MNDTRDTLICNMALPMVSADNEMGDDIASEVRPAPRFKAGDIVLAAYSDEVPWVLYMDSYWDREFGGWLVVPRCIGVHESNCILAAERDQWVPHAHGLWSWWETAT